MNKCEKRLWSKFKASCKHRKIENRLSVERYVWLTRRPCTFCGASESNEIKYGGEVHRYNGIDRLDPNEPYEDGNVVTCCRFCNSLKGSMPLEYWYSFMNDVHLVMSHKGYYLTHEDWEDLREQRKSKTFKSRF